MKLSKSLLLLLGVAVIFLAACTPKTANEYVAEAQQFIREDKVDSAVVVLKTALREYPEDAYIRFLLGKAYVSQGEAEPAQKELELALQKNWDINQVMPELLTALFLQQDHLGIIKLVESNPEMNRQTRLEALTLKVLSHLQLREEQQALQAQVEAMQLDENSEFHRLSDAFILTYNKDLHAAQARLSEFLPLHPNLPHAVLLNAALASNLGQLDKAVSSYEHYATLLPKHSRASLLLANAYIDNQQFEQGEPLVDKLLKIARTQPLLNQLKAVVRFNDADYVQAKEFAEKAIQNGLDGYVSRLVAGMSAMELQTYEQAYNHLSKIQSAFDATNPAGKALTFAKLKLGLEIDTDSWVTNEASAELDFEVLTSASLRLLQQGRSNEANQIFTQVAGIELDRAQSIAKKGLVNLLMDKNEQGADELISALKKEPGLERARLALAAYYMENGLVAEVEKLANEWLRHSPDNVSAHNLLAVAYLRQGNVAQAEATYQKILALEPNSIAPLMFQAEKAEMAGDLAVAASYYQKILDNHINYLSALERYFNLSKKIGDTSDVLARANFAVAKHPDNQDTKGMYSSLLAIEKRYHEVLKLWEGSQASQRLPLAYWVSYGDSLAATGQIDKAEAHFKHWADIHTESAVPIVKLAMFKEVQRDFSAGLEVVQTGLRRFADEPLLHLLQVNFLNYLKRYNEAEAAFKALPNALKNTVSAQGLYGQSLLRQGNAEAAIPLLERYYMAKKTSRRLGFLLSAYTKAGRGQDARQLLTDVIRETPDNIMARTLLADLNMQAFPAQAMSEYQSILKLQPDNAIALNNIAWMLYQEGKYTAAEPYAEKASELLPDTGQTLDTYGMILLRQGKNEQALSVLQKALAKQPRSIQQALHLTEALIVNQQTGKAKAILDQIKTDDQGYLQQVNKLRAML